MFENSQFKSPYGMYDPNYITQLEEENKRLKEQQRQMSDPIRAEFQNSKEYQEAKKNNVLTFLFELVFPQWQASELGKQFSEWDKKQFEVFKSNKVPKTNTATTMNNQMPSNPQMSNTIPNSNYINPNSFNQNGQL